VLLKETGRRDAGAPKLFVKDIIPAASLRGKVVSVNPRSSAVQFNGRISIIEQGYINRKPQCLQLFH
jgi:hypothetical protein